MEWLIGFGVLALLFFVGIPLLAGIAGAGLAVKEAGARDEAQAKAPELLDELFATDAATVTYKTKPYNAMKATTVIEGAIARGWELVHDDDGTLLFKRAS